MSGFKVGDKVRVHSVAAEEGAVTQVLENWASRGESMYVVQFDHFNDTYGVEELELVEAAPTEPVVGGVIEFDQIRQGDRVRCVREFEDGFVITMEGVAERLLGEANGKQVWRMGQTHAVATSEKGIAVQQHHILLAREEPKEWIVLVKRGENLYDTATGGDRPMTETAAKAFADKWNGKSYHSCSFLAVKIPEGL